MSRLKESVSQLIEIQENGLYLVFEVTEEKDVRFLHFSSLPFVWISEWDDKTRSKFRLVEIHFSGENQNDHHGSKHTGTYPGNRLRLQQFHDKRTSEGRKLLFEMIDEQTGVEVVSIFQFYSGIPVIKAWTEVSHKGNQSVGLEYVSSFAYTGIDKEGLTNREDKIKLHIPHNSWYGEAQWKKYSLQDLGLYMVNKFSMKRLSYSSNGTWSSSQYAPMAFLENLGTGSGLVWQIEHNGSWHWEISDISEYLYLQLSGPTEAENHWWKELKPGEEFTSVPVSIGAVSGGFEQAIGELTKYRRRMRRPNEDNKQLPVIFNDYMNCLFGDPTTEKLLPIIDAASEVGCEYFCIDCGWYSDGYWWDGVGEWLPSQQRFPNGIKEVLDYIGNKGMIPGLWLELEVMGINSPLADKVPDGWFFLRHGKRVIDHSRYQLDFRNPEVLEFANGVINRLVNQYGVGYIKMDYNINAGIGTEREADSFGDGLLEHNRAYLSWLDSIFDKYPDLVIENCGSGGMRMDYALLSRHSIQSVSDQTDYLKNGAIAAAAASLVTPEQCAVWSYPLKEGDNEEVIFNMVNSLLLRIHQSGHLAEINSERLHLVKEAISYYKEIREYIANGNPIWPTGIPNLESPWMCFGLQHDNKYFLAVWRLQGDNECFSIPLSQLEGLDTEVKLSYPLNGDAQVKWNKDNGTLTVCIPKQNAARIFEVTVKQ
ncbi:glycoside hydrolase family 36 protein [Peribacillus simplex]|uniref:Alpha-galactosidase n=1 Tax=Peribacillus simplex NBRC 15720 = DSM 1321 TaxID=1349754 RepID=A0A223EP42_9BACI|nr:glycoside hydrolase family 36 protein [Peribacillus simplex]ASS97000.1 alpha-galactosidase [Peribacillus simplex NBRC 15720 = DSM 1321]MEC1398660.1 alpha-galactosidase [Peribacillus simplex]